MAVCKDYNLETDEEQIEPAKIIWKENDRYAIIAFLLLFVDRKMNGEDLKKLDVFMGITGTEINHDDDKLAELISVRDAIIREGGAFLDGIDPDDNSYDCIMDECDRVIDGNDKCKIGNGYYYRFVTSFTCNNLRGAPYLLFDYIKMVIFDNNYSGDRKRLLKHIARKWDIDKSVLSTLESALKSLNEISKKHAEIEESDMPHREAVSALAELKAREKTVWKELNKLEIAKDRSVSEDEDDSSPEEDDGIYEEKLSDKISDGIVAGIEKVGDLLCAPFEWMTDKLIDWM